MTNIIPFPTPKSPSVHERSFHRALISQCEGALAKLEADTPTVQRDDEIAVNRRMLELLRSRPTKTILSALREMAAGEVEAGLFT